jgi:hypothetical protein
MEKPRDFTECEECKRYENRTQIAKILEYYSSFKDYCKLEIKLIRQYKFKSLIRRQYLWAKLGRECIEKYEKIECLNEEHAIIIANSTNSNKNLFVHGSGIDLLIEYFDSNRIKFKIFSCYNSKCFDKSITKTKAQNLWIFGHGDRHGIYFENKIIDYIPFCKIAGTCPRSFIAQLHCCNLTGKTMWEYLSEKPGIFSEGFRNTFQNREDIKKWITENQKKRLYECH